MKLLLTKDDQIKLKKLFQTKNNNIEYSNFFNEYINDLTDDDFNIFNVNDFKKKLLAILDLTTASEIANFDNHVGQGIKLFKNSDVAGKAFYQHFQSITNHKLDNLTLYKEEYYRGEPFIYNDVIVDPNDYYVEKLQIGLTTEKISFLTLAEEKYIWMSLNLNEQLTMQDAINNAQGRVLILGLGLGYFAYMCHLKQDVTSLTIIEKNEQIIRTFTKYILPLFNKKVDIKIINDDAINYSKSHCQDFDYVFFDIYRDVTDGLPFYFKMRQETNFTCKIDFWLESSMIAMLRRIIIVILESSYYNKKLYNLDNYPAIFAFFETKLSNKTFLNYDEIKKFISDKNIILLIENRVVC